jgi:hypothetical protein
MSRPEAAMKKEHRPIIVPMVMHRLDRVSEDLKLILEATRAANPPDIDDLLTAIHQTVKALRSELWAAHRALTVQMLHRPAPSDEQADTAARFGVAIEACPPASGRIS